MLVGNREKKRSKKQVATLWRDPGGPTFTRPDHFNAGATSSSSSILIAGYPGRAGTIREPVNSRIRKEERVHSQVQGSTRNAIGFL